MSLLIDLAEKWPQPERRKDEKPHYVWMKESAPQSRGRFTNKAHVTEPPLLCAPNRPSPAALTLTCFCWVAVWRSSEGQRKDSMSWESLTPPIRLATESQRWSHPAMLKGQCVVEEQTASGPQQQLWQKEGCGEPQWDGFRGGGEEDLRVQHTHLIVKSLFSSNKKRRLFSTPLWSRM